MTKTLLELVIFGCTVAAILRGHGVDSLPIQDVAASVQSNQNMDLEEQLKQQSGENKSSQPALPSADQDDADPQYSPAEDALADDAQATGLSSDYYDIPSSEDSIDATQPERVHNQLAEDNSDEGKPPAAAAAAAAEEEDVNSDGNSLSEETYNEHDGEDMDINFEERSFEGDFQSDDAEEIENHEKNREMLKEDDVELTERPWKEDSGIESHEALPNDAASDMTKLNEEDDVAEERKQDNAEQPKETEYEEGVRETRKKPERQRYEEDGKENTYKILGSRLLIEREKKTFQGRTLATDLDKSGRTKDGEKHNSDGDYITGYA